MFLEGVFFYFAGGLVSRAARCHLATHDQFWVEREGPYKGIICVFKEVHPVTFPTISIKRQNSKSTAQPEDGNVRNVRWAICAIWGREKKGREVEKNSKYDYEETRIRTNVSKRSSLSDVVISTTSTGSGVLGGVDVCTAGEARILLLGSKFARSESYHENARENVQLASITLTLWPNCNIPDQRRDRYLLTSIQ